MLPLSLLLLISLCVSPSMHPLAHARLINVTIDDTTGDPTTHLHITYNPPIAWRAGNEQNCKIKCISTAWPDPAQTNGKTWHEGVFPPWSTNTTRRNVLGVPDVTTAEMQFNGSAVYVYTIITRSLFAPYGNTDLTFYLDDSIVGNFELSPNGETAYLYNQLVYMNESLEFGWHNLTIAMGGAGKSERAMVLLDYVMYTTESTDQKYSLSTPIIAVLACTILSACFIIAFALFMRCRSVKKRQKLVIAEQQHELDLIELRRLVEGVYQSREGLNGLRDPWDADEEVEAPPVYTKKPVISEEVRLL